MNVAVKLMKAFFERFGIAVLKQSTLDDLIHKCQMFDEQAFTSFGHYYSPYPDPLEIKKNEARIFDTSKNVLGIDLDEARQMKYLEEAAKLFPSLPFSETKQDNYRYWYDNDAYHFFDGLMLHTMMRTLKPQRIVEVGSGYSSCMILDTNQHYFNDQIRCTFIEPHPERLFSLLTPKEKKNTDIRVTTLQEVDMEVFRQLKANDILLVDSTHVSKVNSDVNKIIFDILPILETGVFIHVHDIFYPFEIPKEWVYENRAWNEVYLLRAFLMYNRDFQIEYFHHWMNLRHEDYIEGHFPPRFNHTGGHIWLQKTSVSNETKT